MTLQTPSVTKISVTEPQERLYTIVLNLTIDDDEAEWDGINQDFSIQYNHGDSIQPKEAEMIKQMQEVIDRYKNAKAVFKSTTLDNAITNIQDGLVI